MLFKENLEKQTTLLVIVKVYKDGERNVFLKKLDGICQKLGQRERTSGA